MARNVHAPVIVLQQGGKAVDGRKSIGFDWDWGSLSQLTLSKKRYRISTGPLTPRLFCSLLRKVRADLKRQKKDPSLANLLASRYEKAIREGVGACCDAAAHFEGGSIPFPVPEGHNLQGLLTELFADPAKICPDLPKGTKVKIRLAPKAVVTKQ